MADQIPPSIASPTVETAQPVLSAAEQAQLNTLNEQLANPATAAAVPEALLSPQPVVVPEPNLMQELTTGAAKVADDLMTPYGSNVPLTLSGKPKQTSLPQTVVDSVAAEQAAQRIKDAVESGEFQNAVTQQAQQKVDQVLQPQLQQFAAKSAMDELASLRQASDRRLEKLRGETDTAIKAVDDQVRQGSLSQILQDGSWGQRLGAVLAIGLGSVGAALTGQPNAALSYFDKMAEAQAQKDKLNADQKESLKRQLYEQGVLELKKLEAATDSAYKKDQINMQRQQLNNAIAAARAQQEATAAQNTARASIFSGARAISEDEFAALEKNEREAVVSLADGRKVMAVNKSAAEKLRAYMADTVPAIQRLEQYKQLIESGNPLNLKDRAKAEGLSTAIVGALRLPLTGPGVLTDTERAELRKAIGRFGVFNLSAVEREKVKLLIKDLKANTQYNARISGVKLPVIDEQFYRVGERMVPETKLVELYKKRNPKLSDEQIVTAIQKSLPQH
jgi:hypothetical protein